MPRLSLIVELVPRDGRLWLVVAAGILLAGWAKGINLLMLLAYLMLAIWVVNLIIAVRQSRRLSARRIPHGQFFAGTPSAWDVELSNPVGAAAAGWRILDCGPAHQGGWFLDRLDGGQTVRLQARAVFPKRGAYPADAVVGRCLHPFGLVQRTRTLAAAEQWFVLPALGKLDIEAFRAWLARMARSDGQVIRTSRPSMIRQDDLHGLRPFRPGDSPRWIHWRTSARRNQKMVREFEEAAGQNLIMILDPWTPTADVSALDRAISLAATICWEWSRHGHDQLFFAVASRDPVAVAGSATREKSLLMLRALAVVEAEPAPDITPLLHAVAHKVVPAALAVVVSARPNSPLAGRLASAWNRRVVALHVGDAKPFYEEPLPSAASGAAKN
jgi:uncharacterized protein (DUF58 family)